MLPVGGVGRIFYLLGECSLLSAEGVGMDTVLAEGVGLDILSAGEVRRSGYRAG